MKKLPLVILLFVALFWSCGGAGKGSVDKADVTMETEAVNESADTDIIQFEDDKLIRNSNTHAFIYSMLTDTSVLFSHVTDSLTIIKTHSDTWKTPIDTISILNISDRNSLRSILSDVLLNKSNLFDCISISEVKAKSSMRIHSGDSCTYTVKYSKGKSDWKLDTILIHESEKGRVPEGVELAELIDNMEFIQLFEKNARFRKAHFSDSIDGLNCVDFWNFFSSLNEEEQDKEFKLFDPGNMTSSRLGRWIIDYTWNHDSLESVIVELLNSRVSNNMTEYIDFEPDLIDWMVNHNRTNYGGRIEIPKKDNSRTVSTCIYETVDYPNPI